MEDKIEKLIKEALNKEVGTSGIDNCLNDDIFERIYKNTLADDERLKVLEHLDKCSSCRTDLAFYMELMNPQPLIKSIFEKLQCIKSLLLKLPETIEFSDFKVFCSKISEVSEQIIKKNPLDEIEVFLDDIFLKLNVSPASIKVPNRGPGGDKEGQEIDHQKLINEAQSISSIADKQLNIIIADNALLQTNWAGLPETWIFSHLTEPFKKKAVKIRDFCEEKLEIIGYDTRHGGLPLLGVGHTKRVLAHAASFLRAFENYFCDPQACFTVFAGCYCYDLGFMLKKDSLNIIDKYNDRNIFSADFITGKSDSGFPSHWQEVGFESFQEAALIAGICTGSLKDFNDNRIPLPKVQSIFMDNQSLNISVRAISAILGLSNLLDLRESRISHLSKLKTTQENTKLIMECIKNEIVENIEIDKEGKIIITCRIKYQYPDSLADTVAQMPNEIINEIEPFRAVLKECAVYLPQPQIQVKQSLFVQAHPYLYE